MANSNLYRAIRAAFAEALGEDAVPSGEDFLRLFARKGCWLVDLADRPVNRLPPKERRAAVEAGVPQLADVIRETKPKHIVVIKRDIVGYVERAITASATKRPTVLALRYPLRQWRPEFVRTLAANLREKLG
jgi:hypothetical protein